MTSFSHDWTIWVMFFSPEWSESRITGTLHNYIQCVDKIEAMIKKLELFSVCINKDNTGLSIYHCMIFLCANELKSMDNVKCDIAKQPSELGAHLRRYIPKTEDTNNWICYPFHALPPVHLPISEQESLIDIATCGSEKIVFNQKPRLDING